MTPFSLPPLSDHRRLPGKLARDASDQGVALVLVLSFLVLITVLIVAFFASVTTELNTAKNYVEGATAKQLADSAVQYVMGSIRQGTSGDGTTAWASQPGMIRTYNAAGDKLAYYKLYSSDNMVVSGTQIAGFDFATSDLVMTGGSPTDWTKQKAIFTDLNAPVSALDPAATGGQRTIYPIVDPVAVGPVAGFSIDNTSSTSPVVTGGNPAPMPVKWLYVLRDGTMTAPSGVDSTGHKATWTGTGTNVPTATNPIVGRVAFWTDDETCKVNINTASEGSYWDTPRAYSKYEYNTLSVYQPFQHEYQRYPGHPATTSLSTVFGNLTQKEDFYKIVPRTTGNGSINGTALPGSTNPDGTANKSPLAIRTDRLYASIDELMFQPNRQQNNNVALLSNSTSLSKGAFETAKFFITASSRAPDVNLFGKPRVSLWPITLKGASATNAVAKTTHFDDLLSFCSTIKLNGAPPNDKSLYYFQRFDNNSATTDLPSVNPSTTAPLYRNRTLLEYLRTLTSKPVPGFGGNLLDKYLASDRDQILTEMFDYIRCTNLRDSTLNTPTADPNFPTEWPGQYTYSSITAGQVVPIVDVDHPAPSGGRMRGFGRYHTVEQAALLFIGTDDHSTHPADSTVTPADPGVAAGTERVQAAFFPQFFDPSFGFCLYTPFFTYIVRGLDAFKWNDKPMGFPAKYVMGWPTKQFIANVTFFGASLDPRYPTYRPTNNQNGFGGNNDPAAISGKTTFDGANNTALDMPLANASTFHFTGGDVTIEIHAVTQSYTLGATLQTIVMHIPDGDFPVPRTPDILTVPTTGPNPYPNAGKPVDYKNIYSRFVDPRNNQSKYSTPIFTMITSRDVVRSVVATPGDIRLMAAREMIPITDSSKFYAPLPSYSDSTNSFSHTLYTGVGRPLYGATGGKLVTATYPYAGYQASYVKPYSNDAVSSDSTDLGRNGYGTAAPHLPTSTGAFQLVGGAQVPGDWDNGVGNIYDGPYINKADEGSSTANAGNGNAYYNLPYADLNASLTSTIFSPNRLVQSAVQFGSLPSGVWANKPWQTLLFRPGPAMHPGLGMPTVGSDPSMGPYSKVPDHLWLDLFTMPVVEPYAISEPLSTAGRINMNYQLAPFTYINRDTALRAVFKSENMLAIPDGLKESNQNAHPYKTGGSDGQNGGTNPGNNWNYSFRQSIDAKLTLAQFKKRFDAKDLFRSASEICSIDLVPADYATGSGSTTAPSRADMDAYWSTHQYVGDNSRERPYANIYPRLTTKSNTFTVHMRVQALQQLPGTRANGTTPWTTWDDDRDVVNSEYRGSQTIERYIDPSDPGLTDDYADSTKAGDLTKTLESHYKFRVLMSKQFAP